MITVARLLPLVTVVAWSVTLVLPVLDSGRTAGPRIVVTSLGGDRLDVGDLDSAFVIAWLAVIGCAVTALLARSLRWWSLLAMPVAVALAAFLIGMIIEPPSLIWDGQDAQGRMTGGSEVAEPALGALAWLVGIVALGAASVCGFVRTRPSGPAQDRPKAG